MGEISPISAKNVDPKLFRQFKADLELILNWETQEALGNEMGIKKTNFNRYVRGYLPVTKGFLKKFYEAWGASVNEKTNHLREDRYLQTAGTLEPTLADVMAILQRIESKIDRQAGPPDKEN